jgi:adenosylcobinamide kinase/adenosylcobinamide-phosphate guanylyltransferase
VITLILGGARSGKSAFAERLALESGRNIVYVATAEAGDEEMRARIERHRARRPPSWVTLEAPRALAAALRSHAAPGRVLLVDCLTLWLSNLIHARGPELAAEREALLAALPALPGEVLLVANEVGAGIVPIGAVNRLFVDEAGLLHQAVARLSDRVYWMVAGCPVPAKGA